MTVIMALKLLIANNMVVIITENVRNNREKIELFIVHIYYGQDFHWLLRLQSYKNQ